MYQCAKFVINSKIQPAAATFYDICFINIGFQNLPRDAIYLPAITIQLKTSRSKSPIGICVVDNLRKFQRNEEDYHVLFNEMFTEPEIGKVIIVMGM